MTYPHFAYRRFVRHVHPDELDYAIVDGLRRTMLSLYKEYPNITSANINVTVERLPLQKGNPNAQSLPNSGRCND